MGNLYKILGLHDFAFSEEIKAAYKKLAMTFHPDRNNGDKTCEESFKVIQSVYEILSDSNLKTRYDEKLRLSLLDKQSIGLQGSSGAKMKNPASSARVRKGTSYIVVNGRFVKRKRL